MNIIKIKLHFVCVSSWVEIESLNYNKEPVSNNSIYGLFNIDNYYSNPLTNTKKKMVSAWCTNSKIQIMLLSISILFYADLPFKIIDQTVRRLI